MVSLICLVHDEKVFENGLKKSLGEQKNVDYELIVIDNKDNQYKSISEAYQESIHKSKGNLILFVHPDIYLLNENELSNMVTRIEKIKVNDDRKVIFGVAGPVKCGNTIKIISSIVHGSDKKHLEDSFFSNEHKEYIDVQTVDACCFAVYRKDLIQYGFSDKLNGYHLCVEELCLRIHSNQKDVVVIPADLWHFSSGGSLDYTYYRETIKLIKMYPNIKSLYTTSFQWEITKLLLIKLKYYEFRSFFHHKILKLLHK